LKERKIPYGKRTGPSPAESIYKASGGKT
jgi:hypothetical protein